MVVRLDNRQDIERREKGEDGWFSFVEEASGVSAEAKCLSPGMDAVAEQQHGQGSVTLPVTNIVLLSDTADWSNGQIRVSSTLPHEHLGNIPGKATDLPDTI